MGVLEKVISGIRFPAASLVLVFLAGTASVAPAKAAGRAALYAAVGNTLFEYGVDLENGSLTRQSSVTLPANVQEAWVNPSRTFLYVAWSNGGASYAAAGGAAPVGDQHGISAYRIDSASGGLFLQGKPASLPSRPIYITTDIDGTHVITAHNDPSGLVVHRIQPDGAVGEEVKQTAKLDFGVYGHQVRVDPSNRTVILVTRGNAPTAAKPEDPGALRIFDYHAGLLSPRQTIAPGGGVGYQIRHLVSGPTRHSSAKTSCTSIAGRRRACSVMRLSL
jgi:6-phosphogluconolactonase